MLSVSSTLQVSHISSHGINVLLLLLLLSFGAVLAAGAAVHLVLLPSLLLYDLTG